MKAKFFDTLISIVFSMTLLAGVTLSNESILNIGVSIAWIGILLSLMSGFFILLSCFIVNSFDEKGINNKIIAALLKVTKKNRFNWLFLINDMIAILCLIISGWIFTAVSVFLTILIITLIKKLALDTVNALNKESE